ncbi:MAG: hypothetical protein WCI77_01520 [Candidatus Omnitrophota bacterium]
MKKNFVAPFLSFVLNGVGQIYNGEIKKGILFFFISLFFSVMLVAGIIFLCKAALSSYAGKAQFSHMAWGVMLVTVAGLLLCLNGLWSIVDAYKVAKRNDYKSKSLS